MQKKYPVDVEQKFAEDPKHYFPGVITGVKNPFPRCTNCDDGGSLVYFHLKDDKPQAVSSERGNQYLNINGVAGWYDAEILLCICPVCQSGRISDWLRDNCGLEGRDLDVTLSSFTHAGPTAEKQEAFEVAAGLLSMGRDARGFVTLWGDYGVGKSHLLMSLVNGFCMMGIQARYITMTDFLAEIKNTFGDRENTQQAVEAAYQDIQVLCIDEIHQVNLTDWAADVIFRLLDKRYTRRDHNLTVMATITAPANMDHKLGYLKSRMRGGIVVQVGGPEMRPAEGRIERKVFEDIARQNIDPAEADMAAETAERIAR
jgi:DNA replication protein DnaC